VADPIPAQKAPYGTQVVAGQRYVWCACGRSKTQPMCDGTHKEVGLKPIPFNAEKTGEVWLCGCKASNNKPFCDGSHKTV
jgi:CDGSH-type Zn-finger protein